MEAALGTWRFVLLYLAAGLGGMTLFFLIAPWSSATIGATSAIVGLLAANAIGKAKSGEDIRGDIYNDDQCGATFMAYSTPNAKLPDQLGYCTYPLGVNPPCKAVNTKTPTFNAARSLHPGGVNALLADGSVRFFKDSVNLQIWRALATSAGGEVVSADSY